MATSNFVLKKWLSLFFEGFSKFLDAQVAREVNSLPRGIYYMSLRQPGSVTSKNKMLADIPNYIQGLYDKRTFPGLRPSLAGKREICFNKKVFLRT